MYPNFYRFLELQKLTGHLMSNTTTFSVSTDGGAFEWTENVWNLLRTPSSVIDLGVWRMVFDMVRFYACAVRVLSEDGEPTVGEYVRREGYSTQFEDMFLVVCNRIRLLSLQSF